MSMSWTMSPMATCLLVSSIIIMTSDHNLLRVNHLSLQKRQFYDKEQRSHETGKCHKLDLSLVSSMQLCYAIAKCTLRNIACIVSIESHKVATFMVL